MAKNTPGVPITPMDKFPGTGDMTNANGSEGIATDAGTCSMWTSGHDWCTMSHLNHKTMDVLTANTLLELTWWVTAKSGSIHDMGVEKTK